MPLTGNFGGQKVAESNQLAKSFTSCLNRQISPLGWWIPAKKAPPRLEYACFIVCLNGAASCGAKNCFAVEEAARAQANANTLPIGSAA
jgi:hypothetical protein